MSETQRPQYEILRFRKANDAVEPTSKFALRQSKALEASAKKGFVMQGVEYSQDLETVQYVMVKAVAK